MTSVTLYHNPRCSKSRQTLALLEEQAVDLEIVQYLKTPPTEAELKTIIDKLGLRVRDVMRSGEAEYKDQRLGDDSLSDGDLVEAIAKTPILLQRPIAVTDQDARIGRPPEAVLEII